MFGSLEAHLEGSHEVFQGIKLDLLPVSDLLEVFNGLFEGCCIALIEGEFWFFHFKSLQ